MEERKSIFKRIHNDGFTWHDNFFIIFLLFVFLSIFEQLIGANFLLMFERKFPSLAEDGFWSLFVKYASTIFAWIVFVGYCAITPRNRMVLHAISSKRKGNTLKMLLLGLLIGGGENAFGILCAILHGDIHLVFEGCNIFGFILMFIAVFVQSSSEELLCRGFLYERLRKGYRSPWVAFLGNALIFMALHLFNPGISVIPIVHLVVVAVFYSVIVYYFDSIWLPMTAHAAWNFTQNIVFGLPNSGIVSSFSAWKLEAGLGQITFFYDPVFGVEGSAFLLIVTIIAFVAVIIIGEKKKRNE